MASSTTFLDWPPLSVYPTDARSWSCAKRSMIDSTRWRLIWPWSRSHANALLLAKSTASSITQG
eukprot:6144044-Pyramimonas_sp.AAC.1